MINRKWLPSGFKDLVDLNVFLPALWIPRSSLIGLRLFCFTHINYVNLETFSSYCFADDVTLYFFEQPRCFSDWCAECCVYALPQSASRWTVSCKIPRTTSGFFLFQNKCYSNYESCIFLLTANCLSNYFSSPVENHVDCVPFTQRLGKNNDCLEVFCFSVTWCFQRHFKERKWTVWTQPSVPLTVPSPSPLSHYMDGFSQRRQKQQHWLEISFSTTRHISTRPSVNHQPSGWLHMQEMMSWKVITLTSERPLQINQITTKHNKHISRVSVLGLKSTCCFPHSLAPLTRFSAIVSFCFNVSMFVFCVKMIQKPISDWMCWNKQSNMKIFHPEELFMTFVSRVIFFQPLWFQMARN